jgi:XamI restriction endonuclease
MKNIQKNPRTWSDEELHHHAALALEAFVERRIREPRDQYRKHLSVRRNAVLRLFKTLAGVDPREPDPGIVRDVLLDGELLDALRYVAGPPVSSDDLGVLVTRSTTRLSKEQMKTNDALVTDALKLICTLADPARFPWIAARRAPTRREIVAAISSTAIVHATQTIQTERRAYGKFVERQLESRLLACGFRKLKPPTRARIESPSQWPRERTFFGECQVYGRKCDLLIGTSDGRIIAVEAKDSSSIVNSVKRVLNDTAAKASQWQVRAGKEIVPVALLSGVFGSAHLVAAQNSGLYLVWAHDLDGFVEWLSAQ